MYRNSDHRSRNKIGLAVLAKINDRKTWFYGRVTSWHAFAIDAGQGGFPANAVTTRAASLINEKRKLKITELQLLQLRSCLERGSL